MLYFIINYNKGDIMVQAIVNIGEFEDRVLNIVKGKFGLRINPKQLILLLTNMRKIY